MEFAECTKLALVVMAVDVVTHLSELKFEKYFALN